MDYRQRGGYCIVVKLGRLAEGVAYGAYAIDNCLRRRMLSFIMSYTLL
ncbi:unnamed protein product [Strongylus vulgaris]|uniref:Uncharacterized protein n=1 Tax=Strongylus vulgaris TaxID=40348 RepID=A0A3P7HZ70_STRVU|nr:unnamed protein product [Strongylus vulgaris]